MADEIHDNIVQTLLGLFPPNGFPVADGWVHGFGDSCFRLRKSLVSMGAPAGVKIDLPMPLPERLHFERNGEQKGNHFIGSVYLLGVDGQVQVVYDDAYWTVNGAGAERVVVVFHYYGCETEMECFQMIVEKMGPLMNRALGRD